MDTNDVRLLIDRLIAETLAEKGAESQPITDDTVLLGGNLELDSLDLASIVVNLSEATEKDPFSEGFIEFRTVGELAALYGG